MKIESPLVQIYFLALRPQDTVNVAAQLPDLKLRMEHEEHKVGPWMQFSWMGRHGLCAMREVNVTSGLDSFFLEGNGLPGIQDVAEVMVFPFASDPARARPKNGLWVSSLAELREGKFKEALGFVTFVRLNRALLENKELWAGARANLPVPSLADLLRGTAGALQRASEEGVWKDDLGPDLRLMLTAGCGDSEIVILGTARKRDALDKLLFLLARLGADSISAALHGDALSREMPVIPAITETVTELLVPMSLYGDALAEATQSAGQPEARPGRTLNKRLKNCLEGEVGGQLWLKRGVSSIADLGDAVRRATGKGWMDLTALGSVDVLVQPSTGKRKIHHLLWMLARLDAAAAREPGFPRKVAFHLTFDHAWGQLAHQGQIIVPDRTRMLGFAGGGRLPVPPPELPFQPPPPVTPPELPFQTMPEDIVRVRQFVEELRRLCWREDIRVIERMAERSLAIRKNESLPAETRLMADRCLHRLSRAVERLRKLESLLQTPPPKGEEDQWKLALNNARQETVGLRRHIVAAGMLFDKAVTHHMRGTLPLLLQPAFQARGPEHFCSEVILSAGMAAFPRSVVGKMLDRIASEQGEAGARERQETRNEALARQEMISNLRLVATPILYASHDEDFQIAPLLSIIRIPRWVLWYPTASSMVVHEVGHSLSNLANFPMGLRALLTFFDNSEEGRRIRDRLRLLPWMQKLKLITRPDKPPPRSVSPDLKNEMEEVCADVTWRICCYGREDGAHFVYDYLKHMDGRSARTREQSRQMFLQRLLADAVATGQILRVWQAGGHSLLFNSSEAAHQSLSGIVTRLISDMRDWVRDQPPPLVPAAGQFATEVEAYCAELESLIQPGSETKLEEACGMGQLVAYLWLYPVFGYDPTLSSFHWVKAGHMVWNSLLSSALSISEADEKQLHQIAEEIIQGKVPILLHTSYPERLPALVERLCRARRRSAVSPPQEGPPWKACEIPVHARFALSIYLQSSIIYSH